MEFTPRYHIGEYWQEKIENFDLLLREGIKYYENLLDTATKEEILENPIWYANAKNALEEARGLRSCYLYRFESIIKKGEK